MTDFSQLTDETLEEKYRLANEIHDDLSCTKLYLLGNKEQARYKENIERIDDVIEEMELERYRRAMKNAESFLRSIEKL